VTRRVAWKPVPGVSEDTQYIHLQWSEGHDLMAMPMNTSHFRSVQKKRLGLKTEAALYTATMAHIQQTT
jgi:hypothetical protein